MENKVLYFGYGANSQREMMEAITGNKNLVGQPGILREFKLCVQRMDQVPNTVFLGSPSPVSPQQILKENWGDDFETYIIKPGNETDEVAGTVWELTSLERELVKDWELVYLGWYKNLEGIAVTKDGHRINVQTEGFRGGQEVDREVNGKNYKPFLNRLEDFQRVAEKAKKEYLERNKAQDMRVALVYDRLNKWGGAERVLLALHKLFPDAPLYTSVYDKKKTPWADIFNVKTSFLQNFPFAIHHELYAFLMPLAFESFSSQGGSASSGNFDEYDLVISVTSESAKGIITKPQTKHICYCLTPTRYLWSGYDDYFKNPVLKFISKPVIWYLKFWDKIAAQRPDKFIAISKEVQSRISKYYDRESVVVYPPLSISNFKIQNPKSKNDNYFLIVSRLVPYKRIDLAVRAFNKLQLPLKIIGTGSEMERLRGMAKSNIEFLGNLTDKELVRYYSECRALIFPGNEDFGLTILEAQSFGKSVIAFRNGGALETIVEGRTGVFFNEPTVESLSKTIQQFNKMKFDPKECIENSHKYSFEEFKKNFLSEIKKI